MVTVFRGAIEHILSNTRRICTEFGEFLCALGGESAWITSIRVVRVEMAQPCAVFFLKSEEQTKVHELARGLD